MYIGRDDEESAVMLQKIYAREQRHRERGIEREMA